MIIGLHSKDICCTKGIMALVTVIITTYNRFDGMIIALESVRQQTHQNIEVIIVNDCSTDKRYYDYDYGDAKVHHLRINSKNKFGFACPGGYQRNFGLAAANGEYIAFLDDDDAWLPNKIELQLHAMQMTGCQMCCTDSYIGPGLYDPTFTYAEKYLENIKPGSFGRAARHFLREAGVPIRGPKVPRTDYEIWDLEHIKPCNTCICSTVMLTKKMCDIVGQFVIAPEAEDYLYWGEVLKHTHCVYIPEQLAYYSTGLDKSWEPIDRS